jgi:hypothetical protein
VPPEQDLTPEDGVEKIDIGPATSGPRMRAWGPHDVVRRIEEFQPGTGRRLRARVPPVALEALQRTGRFEWISMRNGREFSAAALAVLGDEGFARFFRWMLPAQLDRPMVRGIIKASVAVFGLTPHTFMRASASFWRMAFLEVGTARLEDPKVRSVTFVLEDIPPDAFVEDAFLRSIAASFAGYFDVCKVDGRVDLNVDRDARVARFDVSW